MTMVTFFFLYKKRLYLAETDVQLRNFLPVYILSQKYFIDSCGVAV